MSFKAGDKVYIINKVPSRFPGWNNVWNDREMTPYVNDTKIYTIASIRDNGITLIEIGFGWPKEALSLVERCPPPLTKEEKINAKCKKLWNNSKYVKKNPKYTY